MKTFIQHITESLDKPYSYTLTGTGPKSRFWIAKFKSDNGTPYEVTIGNVLKRHWDISFKVTNVKSADEHDLTGTGDEFRVFATILDVVRDFLQKRGDSVDRMEFSASKSDKSRAKLYGKLARKYMPDGWSLNMKDAFDYVKFEIEPRKY